MIASLLVASCAGMERYPGGTGVGPHGAPHEWLRWLEEHRQGIPRLNKFHHYLEIYERHFARFRGQPVRLLEIGVDHGGSLRMWRWYFGANAIICGSDINNRTRVYKGNPFYGSPNHM